MSGYALIVALLFTSLFSLWRVRKRPYLLVTGLVFSALFFVNLFLNPMNLDFRRNNVFLAKMAGQQGGEFSFRRIIFDTSGKFHTVDGFKGITKYHGVYRMEGDTIFLLSNRLPIDFSDTMYIVDNKSRLQFSKKMDSVPMNFRMFEKPEELRLDIAKRTAFEIE